MGKTRPDWINENLSTTIDMLTDEEVCEWEALLETDEKRFYAEAIFGYVTRQQQIGVNKKELPHAEMMAFCREFLIKIRLAATGSSGRGIKLFEISGIQVTQ